MPKKQSGMAQDWTQNRAVPPRCRPNKDSVMYQLSYWAIPRKEFLIVLKSQNFVPDMTPQPEYLLDFWKSKREMENESGLTYNLLLT